MSLSQEGINEYINPALLILSYFIFLCFGFSVHFYLTVHLSAPLPWKPPRCANNTRKGNLLFESAGTSNSVKKSDFAFEEKNILYIKKTLLIMLNLDPKISFKNLATRSCELTATLAAAFYLWHWRSNIGHSAVKQVFFFCFVFSDTLILSIKRL